MRLTLKLRCVEISARGALNLIIVLEWIMPEREDDSRGNACKSEWPKPVEERTTSGII